MRSTLSWLKEHLGTDVLPKHLIAITLIGVSPPPLRGKPVRAKRTGRGV